METTESTGLGLKTPFYDAASEAIHASLREIDKNWDGTLAGDDVEALHDLRVATRRLRAALSVYEAVFPPKIYRRVEKTVAQLTDALGPGRDTDVLIEHLVSVADALDSTRATENPGLSFYIETLRKERADQQSDLDAAMRAIDLKQLQHEISQSLPGN